MAHDLLRIIGLCDVNCYAELHLKIHWNYNLPV